MALQEQHADVDLTRGLDTRTAGKLVLGGRVTTAQDMQWRGKVMERCNGFGPLGTINTALPIQSLTSYQGELLLQQQNLLSSWLPTPGHWDSRQDGFSPFVTQKQMVYRSATSVLSADVDTNGSLTAYAWFDTPNNGATSRIQAGILDESTGAYVSGGALHGDFTVLSSVAANTASPRVVFFGTTIMVLWVETGTGVRFSTNSTTNPGIWSVPATVAGTAAAVQIDAIVISGRLFVAYRGATDIFTVELNSSGTVLSGPVDNGTAALNFYALGQSNDGFLFLIYENAAAAHDLRRIIYNLNLTVAQADAQVSAASHFNSLFISYGSAATACIIYYDRRDATGVGQTTFWAQLNSNGTFGSVDLTFVRGAAPATNAVSVNGALHLWLRAVWGVAGGSPNTQVTVGRSMFLYRDNQPSAQPSQLGRSLFGADIGATGLLPRIASKFVLDSAGNPFTVGIELYRLQLFGNLPAINYSPLGVSRLNTKLAPVPIQKAQLGNLLVMPGSLPMVYDGDTPYECGFSQYPELAAAADGGAGGLSAGTYFWAFTYEWTDRRGERWQSIPSSPIPAAGLVLAAGHQGSLTIPTLRQTRIASGIAASGRQDPQIVIWRTVANGSTFFRSSPPGQGPVNNPSADTVTFTDNVADSNIQGNEILYAGGALANVPPPACQYAVTHRSRIFLLGLEDPNAYWFSRKWIPGQGINFNDGLQGQVTPWGGPLTGGASIDDKFIFFERTATAVMYGDGPDNLGQQNSFTPPDVINRDIGCVDARSIVVTTFGVLFLSLKGFYLLDRGLQFHYLGAPVEGLVNPYGSPQIVITSGNQLTARHEIRWTTSTGTLFVLDYADALAEGDEIASYDKLKWTTRTNYPAKDATLLQDTFVFAYDTGGAGREVVQEDDLSNRRVIPGNILGIAGQIETSWIKVSGVQGFQRVWWAIFTGSANGAAHAFTVDVGFDYNPTYNYTFTFTAGTTDPWQFRHKPHVQKCQAIRFRITGDGANVARWSIESIALKLGVKRGLFKLPATAST